MELSYRSGDGLEAVRVSRSGNELNVEVRGQMHRVKVTQCASGRLHFLLDGRSVSGAFARSDRGLEVWIDGEQYLFGTLEADADSWGGAAAGGASDGRVLTPMPGKVVAVNVVPSDRVEAGRALLVLESMKMQNDILAPGDGVVTAVHHAVGDSVEFGDVLIEIDLDEKAAE